jgi:hypothetical protein
MEGAHACRLRLLGTIHQQVSFAEKKGIPACLRREEDLQRRVAAPNPEVAVEQIEDGRVTRGRRGTSSWDKLMGESQVSGRPSLASKKSAKATVEAFFGF